MKVLSTPAEVIAHSGPSCTASVPCASSHLIHSRSNNITIMDKNKIITTQEEARDYAIEWQNWQSEQSLSYGEVAEWAGIFRALAEKFDLIEEFEENGII